MSTQDSLQRFLFQDLQVRGEVAGLDQSYRQALASHPYPEIIQRLLGEMMAAAALLSATLKFDGSLSIQAQGKGKLRFMMAECVSGLELRAVARLEGEVADEDFRTLLGNGTLAITITPNNGRQYQGIVPLEGDSLAACIETYFAQSEQLPTRIWLACQAGDRAAGLILQQLPTNSTAPPLDADGWQRVSQLTATLRTEELLELENPELLHRLYHEENLRLFDAAPLSYGCSCSRVRAIRSLVSLGQTEIQALLDEQAAVEIKCEFCNRSYQLSAAELAPYLAPVPQAEDAKPTLH